MSADRYVGAVDVIDWCASSSHAVGCCLVSVWGSVRLHFVGGEVSFFPSTMRVQRRTTTGHHLFHLYVNSAVCLPTVTVSTQTTISAVGQKGRNIRWPRLGYFYLIITVLILEEKTGQTGRRTDTRALLYNAFRYGRDHRNSSEKKL